MRFCKALFIFVLLSQYTQAYIKFLTKEQLVQDSEYIVVAKVQIVAKAGKAKQWQGETATVLNNKLEVLESLKGGWQFKKPLFLTTYQFDGWMEDNVELPPKGSKVLLFLKKNEKGEYRPVNGIQGVWPMENGEPVGAGVGTTLEQIKEMVQKQSKQIKGACNSKTFTALLDTGEAQTQNGDHKEALKSYRKAYKICPMKDLEEQMAWLLGEVGSE
jgi:hypothetical protein